MPGAMLRLLMIVGVLLCSMHLAEPASAHHVSDDAAFHLSTEDGAPGGKKPAPDLAHAAHHHCPVAPDLGAAAPDMAWILARAPLFAVNSALLRSRVLPPLLDPPLTI